MPRMRSAERRAQLMRVATSLFARHGYEATTTAMIARTARVTEPILYRHFSSKQALFVAIVQDMSDQTMRQWEQLTEGLDDPAARLRRIADHLPQHMRRMADAYHVLHGALAASRDPAVHAVLRQHYREIEAFFARLVSDGQASGAFTRGVDPRAAAWQLIFSGIGYAMIALNLDRLDRKLIDEVIAALVRGIKA